MPVVAMPIMTSAVTSALLRPDLSPKWPKIMPPTGRAKKPTANVLNDASVATSGGRSPEKNSVGKTSAAAVP